MYDNKIIANTAFFLWVKSKQKTVITKLPRTASGDNMSHIYRTKEMIGIDFSVREKYIQTTIKYYMTVTNRNKITEVWDQALNGIKGNERIDALA